MSIIYPFLKSLLVDRYIFFLLIFFLSIHFMPMKSLYPVQIIILKMWQKPKGFQLLNITNNTGQEHLDEINLKLNIIKVDKIHNRHKYQLEIFHLNHIFILTKLLSYVTCFPPKCISKVGVWESPGYKTLGKESTSLLRIISM